MYTLVYFFIVPIGGIGILIPQLEQNNLQQQQQQCNSLSQMTYNHSSSSSSVAADSSTSIEISPTSPPPNLCLGQDGMLNNSISKGFLTNGSDPG
jgi:hypothetical protein